MSDKPRAMGYRKQPNQTLGLHSLNKHVIH